MSKKNKQKQQAQKTNVQVRPILTNEQKLEIEEVNEKLQSTEPIIELSSESENKLIEAENKEDLLKYWNYVKDINKRAESLLNSTKEEKEKTSKLKDELDASKKEADGIKSDLIKRLEDYNKKDKDITEREFSIDNGEYTAVIRRLLDTIKDTEQKVFTDTENLLKELSEFHKKNLEHFSEHISLNGDFEKQQAELKREKKRFEVEKQIFKDDLQDEFETKYSEELTIKTAELERLQRKANNIELENAKLKQFFEDLQNAFDSTEPQEILIKYSFLVKELDTLKKELNERPAQFELEIKQAKIEELHAKVIEYQSKINEGELLELKRILSNMDSYVIEINAYKNQIESARVRETSLKKTIDDLSITIDQLKGETTKKADAFEFAKKCDADTGNLGFNHLQQQKDVPSNLAELSSYVQQWMAFKSDKPFYYSLETIRIFLAGLHMSPISILQGISGTGKTSLPREFTKALLSDGNYVNSKEINDNAPYRICAVQSGWRDNMDLMGYYNSFEHKYKETDFFKALYIANQPKYSDTLFLIILDEMNLSRPEHYFADFLSLLEQSANERYIGLSNTPNEVLPALIKGGKLKIPENVRFIGTANHDETTLEFAPKTYDRSNLMEMPKNHPGNSNIVKDDSHFNIKYSWLHNQFIQSESKYNKECKSFIKFTTELGELLLNEKGIGIGNRLESQAERFISVYLHSGLEANRKYDLAVAADHLITSRLFRTLKNRYDLDKNNLTNFKSEFEGLFKKEFGFVPQYANNLLESEISKK